MVRFWARLRHHVYNCQGCVVFGGSPSLRATGSCPRAYEVCDGSEAGGIFASAFAPRRRIHIQHTHSLHSTLLQGISMKGPGQVRWELLCVCVKGMRQVGFVVANTGRLSLKLKLNSERTNTHETHCKKLQMAAKCAVAGYFRKKNQIRSFV